MNWSDMAAEMVVSSPEHQAAQVRVSRVRANLDRHGVQAIPNLDLPITELTRG